jgi:hypothetical protein
MADEKICQNGLKKQLSILRHMEVYKCFFRHDNALKDDADVIFNILITKEISQKIAR